MSAVPKDRSFATGFPGCTYDRSWPSADCRDRQLYCIATWASALWQRSLQGDGLLLALLFFGGVMNLYWIAGLGVFVLLEKTIPHGHWLASVAGIALIASGVVLAIRAH